MKHHMMAFMSRRMIACDEASFLISYQEDNKLGFKKWWQLKMHLLSCHLCVKYAKQIQQLNRMVLNYRDACNSSVCHHHLPAEAGIKIQKVISRELNAK
ncbi:MAG: hypothetical protein V2B15_12165 [Bacteroidota bacterium]